MESLTFTSLDCEFQIEIQEHDGQITLCLTEFDVDEEKSRENHIHYKPSSVTEVYFSQEELEKISRAFNHFLRSDDDEI